MGVLTTHKGQFVKHFLDQTSGGMNLRIMTGDESEYVCTISLCISASWRGGHHNEKIMTLVRTGAVSGRDKEVERLRSVLPFLLEEGSPLYLKLVTDVTPGVHLTKRFADGDVAFSNEPFQDIASD
jgi:hypothetical protein